MPDASHSQQPTLGDLLEWVGRRWLILVLALVAGAGGGWLLAQTQSETYTSTTLVQVRPVGPDSADDQLNLDTEAQVITSVDTATRVADLIGSTGPAADLTRRVTVLVPPNTTFLEISFDAASPERAQEGAHAFAEAYLTQREEAAQQEIDERINRLDEQIEALRAQDAEDQVIVPLLNQQLLLQAEPVRGGEVRSPASLPGQPSSPNLILFVASGTVAGLLLGLALALLVHRLDSRIFGVSDLPETAVDHVLLELQGNRPAGAVVGPVTTMGRQFSRLRNVMRASADATSASPGSATGVLLVCGVSPGNAAGFVTANLAAAFARAGERVVVVGADPASVGFEALGVDGGPGHGLSDVISGAVAPATAAVPSPEVPRVSVLRAGSLDEGDELPVDEMMRVVLRLAASADRVIIEAPPMSRSIDAQALGVTASALLLVVERQRTTAPQVAAAVRDFQQVRAPFAGLLLVPPAGRGRRRRAHPAAAPAPVPAARIVPSFVDPPAESGHGDPDETVVFGRIQSEPDAAPARDTRAS